MIVFFLTVFIYFLGFHGVCEFRRMSEIHRGFDDPIWTVRRAHGIFSGKVYDFKIAKSVKIIDEWLLIAKLACLMQGAILSAALPGMQAKVILCTIFIEGFQSMYVCMYRDQSMLDTDLYSIFSM